MNSVLEEIGINDFLDDNPGISLSPYAENQICLQGKLYFKAITEDGPEIEDSYELQILIPEDFPNQIPRVKELKNKITNEIAKYHLFLNGFLCLGSPYRIREIVKKNSTITEFTEKCLIPYLYAISNRIRNGGDLIFGELAHDIEGIADDYLEFDDPIQFKGAMHLINLKKRVANKKLCPCGCGKRLGLCALHNKINQLRILKRQFRKAKQEKERKTDKDKREKS